MLDIFSFREKTCKRQGLVIVLHPRVRDFCLWCTGWCWLINSDGNTESTGTFALLCLCILSQCVGANYAATLWIGLKLFKVVGPILFWPIICWQSTFPREILTTPCGTSACLCLSLEFFRSCVVKADKEGFVIRSGILMAVLSLQCYWTFSWGGQGERGSAYLEVCAHSPIPFFTFTYTWGISSRYGHDLE